MKYIDSEKLIAEIEGIIAAVQTTNHPDVLGTMEECMSAAEIEALNLVLDAIKGLQQEQPETSNNLVDVDAVREDFMIEVYRVLDADPTNDRANAIIDAFDSLPTVSQEQPEVDLNKEINRFWDSCIKHKNERGGNVIWSNKLEVEVLARHFFDMGRNARKL